MTAQFSTPTDELLLLAETLGEVKSRTEKLETEFSTQARPLEAATNALSAALSGIKALQFHVLDNNLGALSARVEEMRKAVDEQVGVIALELKKADETNAAKAGAEAEALRSEIVALQSQLGSLVTQFGQQLERVEFAAKEEAKKLQLIPGPAGAAGASLNPRGTFIDGETYNRLDVVSWLGSSYIATVDGVTEKPSKNSNQWQTLASRGGGGAGGVGDFGSLAGVAQINQGGTGQTTRAAALNALLPDQAGSTQYMLLTDGSGTVSWGAQPVAGLPSQTSNSGRLLTTNGSTASWSNAVTVSGSNATVGGTLTVTGDTSTFGINSSTNNSIKIITGVGTTASPRYGLLDFRNYNDLKSGAYLRVANREADTNAFLMNVAVRSNADVLTSIATFSDTQLAVLSTTASLGTSSGALVVSGGVGVAKELYLGIKLNISTHTGDAGGIGFGTETNLYRYQAGGLALDHASGTAPALLFRETGTSTLRLETNSGVGYLSTLTSANLIFRTNSTVALTLDTSQNAIFAGTVRTAAPSGGTAASWKLGSVATVSPTSPNRTIEVDIGGTIYYIHAKTTNN